MASIATLKLFSVACVNNFWMRIMCTDFGLLICMNRYFVCYPMSHFIHHTFSNFKKQRGQILLVLYSILEAESPGAGNFIEHLTPREHLCL